MLFNLANVDSIQCLKQIVVMLSVFSSVISVNQNALFTIFFLI